MEDVDTGLIDLSRAFDARLTSISKDYNNFLTEAVTQLKEALSDKNTVEAHNSELRNQLIKLQDDISASSESEIFILRKQAMVLIEERELLLRCNQSILQLFAWKTEKINPLFLNSKEGVVERISQFVLDHRVT